MGDPKAKTYSGYKSYQYLEPGKDYKSFKLVKQINRIEPFWVPLTENEEKRVNDLYRKCVVVAVHDHAKVFPEQSSDIVEYNKLGRCSTAYEGLGHSCIDAIFDNLSGGTATVTSQSGWHFGDVVYDLGMRLSDIAHQDFVVRCENVEDILDAYKEGKVGFIPAMECATPIENEINRIDVLYGLGIRMMGLTFNESNMIGSGVREERDGGVTYFGQRVIERMNKIGMAVDLSHTGERTSLDAILVSKKPVFISHAGAKGIWNSKRLKSDEVIRACAERGGLVGVVAAPSVPYSRKHPEMDIESVMDHFEYLIHLVGVDHVCLGLDLFYGDHVAFHHAFRTGNILNVGQVNFDIGTGESPPHVDYVKGMENITEGYNNAVRWFVKHGYSDDEIAKLVGGNALRVLKEVWC